jgi:SagB-type dehydrogenase family enzyme
MVARFDKIWWKYPHSRSYRLALLDVGHLSQTFHLACAAHSLKSWLTGVFYDDELARRLQLDGTREAVLLTVGAGHGPATGVV